jgi:hypothetical protein
MIDGQIARIERELGTPGLLELLSTRLAPTDLQSLLLEVHARVAAAVTPARLLAQYRESRFVAPSPVSPRALVEVDRLAWSLLPDGYEPLELSPLCPLGTNSAVAPVSQHKVVSTDRTSEVVADSTNVLALECAVRRHDPAARRREPVRLAASHRLTRAQQFGGARSWAHFRVLSLVAAGRDEGDTRFETRALVEQIAFCARLVEGAAALGRAFGGLRIAVTDVTDGALTDTLETRVLAPLRERFPAARCHLAPERTAGRGYYGRVCFKLYATNESGDELELADGGDTSWTRTLLGDEKERLVVSGLGVERLCVA